ncbi:hypothetical protein I203_101058 [Kwoniella mangroviensis CBS 8507]|uniref:uncharacterized protein n=1 Tax=Kwoniella mangroviensis CBS 8507 TaxID=1296122 RepID=UPI00080D2BC4|nr:alpha-glucosidase [Kwoniella mangroviensis CBS 8507]OCF68035.1 alpha-glucosidase [Kwoniella mangroviensis CBS 8507]
MEDADWWRQAIVYQIYPRSFADLNGDGIGDLQGITSRVPYLRDLGVDAVWLSPFYPSALKDGGYDVADYRNVDPKIGTLEEFDEMSRALKQAGIRVIVDIVPNHSSDDHQWFKDALKAGKGSTERDRYIFRDGLGPDKSQPPTDWQSIFGGPSWTPSGTGDGQWYFHWYDSSQPDFNWDNADVREDFLTTLKFWGDRGVSGFRIDVAHGLAKDMSEPLLKWTQLKKLTERKLQNGNGSLKHPLLDREEVHEIYKDWRKLFDTYDPPLMAVAEAWVAPDQKGLYASSDGLGQAFSFDMLLCNFNIQEYRECIDRSIAEAKRNKSSTTWVLSNHDVIRHATRLGLPDVPNSNLRVAKNALDPFLADRFKSTKLDIESGLRRARAAILMILALPGLTYIYQGEELGLQEVVDIEPSQRQDPAFHRTKGEEIGRDGCRVPLPWSSASANFGFGLASGKPAHLPQPLWMADYAVDTQLKDPESTLNLYKDAFKLRKQLLGPEDEFEWVENRDEQVLHFRRSEGWQVVVNVGKDEVALPIGEVLLSSNGKLEEGFRGKIPGETTVWLKNVQLSEIGSCVD